MRRTVCFLDLPTKIRCHIYKCLFDRSHVEIELPIANRRKTYWTTIPNNRCLPGILSTSKIIRAESLPVFLHAGTTSLYLFERRNPNVPSVYYRFAQTLILKGWSSWMPDLTLLPQLRTVIIEDQNDRYPWDRMSNRHQMNDQELVKEVCVAMPKDDHLCKVCNHIDIFVHVRYAGDISEVRFREVRPPDHSDISQIDRDYPL
jgi:hypothetical protein